jgi:hypothetical protein
MDCSESGVDVQGSVRLCVHLFVVCSTYMAWYSIIESSAVISNVYGMFTMLFVCIVALVGGTCVVCSQSDVVVYCNAVCLFATYLGGLLL